MPLYKRICILRNANCLPWIYCVFCPPAIHHEKQAWQTATEVPMVVWNLLNTPHTAREAFRSQLCLQIWSVPLSLQCCWPVSQPLWRAAWYGLHAGPKQELLLVQNRMERENLHAWGVGMNTWSVHHPHLTETHARKGADLLALAVVSLPTGSHWETSTLCLWGRKKWERMFWKVGGEDYHTAALSAQNVSVQW